MERTFIKKVKEEKQMNEKHLTQRIFELLDNKRAEDIQILEVTEKTSLADFFVIATGTSTTHVNALAEEVEYQLKEEEKRTPLSVEGLHNGHWILLDYGDIVVHIFHKEDREYYKLDKLWEKMPKTFEVV